MADGGRPGIKALVAYSALRLLLFVAPFLAIWALSGNPIVAAVLAAAIGFSLSVVLLDSQRSSLSRVLSARAERRRPSTDEAVEDTAVDGGGQTSSDSDAASPRP